MSQSTKTSKLVANLSLIASAVLMGWFFWTVFQGAQARTLVLADVTELFVVGLAVALFVISVLIKESLSNQEEPQG